MAQQIDSENEVTFAESGLSAEQIRKGSETNPRLLNLPVDIHIIFGRARLTFGNLLELRDSSVVRLDAKIDDPVELAIGERIFARGALVDDEGGLSVKITQVIDDGV